MNELKDARIAIIGASSGVGRACAERFAALGAQVLGTGRDAGRLAALAAKGLRAIGVDAHDSAAMREVLAGFAPIDHLVISLTADAVNGPFRALDLGAFRRFFEGKFWASLAALQAALPAMAPSGSIVFVGGNVSRTAIAGASTNAAINAALEAMVGPLALELAPLRVNAVAPGLVTSESWDRRLPEAAREAMYAKARAALPGGHIPQPDEVAHAVQFLIENAAVTGTVLDCDGGRRLKP